MPSPRSSRFSFAGFALILGCGSTLPRPLPHSPSRELVFTSAKPEKVAMAGEVNVLAIPVTDAGAKEIVRQFYRSLGEEDMLGLGKTLSKNAPFLVLRGGAAPVAGTVYDLFRQTAMRIDFSPLLTVLDSAKFSMGATPPPGFPRGNREPGDRIVNVNLDLPWDVSEQLFGGPDSHWFHVVLHDDQVRIQEFATEFK